MRWQALFDDLEAQLEAAQAAELAAEVADRERRESAAVGLGDRLRASIGRPLAVHLPAASVLRGPLLDCGVDWLLLGEGAAELLVPLPAVLGISGLNARAAADEGAVARRLDLRRALRAVARSRSGVTLTLSDATTLAGTLDRVAADHVDLAEHLPGEARRSGSVRSVRLVPLHALLVVRST